MRRDATWAGLPVRAVAAKLLARVRSGQGSLADALPEADAVLMDRRDRALLRLSLYSTLRSCFRQQARLRGLLDKPLARTQHEIEALLLIALTQLSEGIDSEYGVVDSSVDAVRALGYPQLAGLVNAVLRRAQREQANAGTDEHASDEVRFNHPQWLIDRIRVDWPEQADAILYANNAEPPLWLRCNRRMLDRATLIEQLSAAQFSVSAHPQLDDALQILDAGEVSKLPGWDLGHFSVQDAAAQSAADLLDLAPGQWVLDACCAPGGKLAHSAEREPELAGLLGLDKDGKRLERTRAAMPRLGLRPTLKQADAAQPEDWWRGQKFDRILLDAPCTGTGVIRRHPDIRLLRRDRDVAELVAQQARLLDALWPLLAAGGRLVYASCSVLKAENEDQIAAFLKRQPEALVRPGNPAWFSHHGPYGSQNLPGNGGADGFFYAVIERQR